MATDSFLKQDRALLWVQKEGPGTPWTPLGMGGTSVTGRSQPGPTKTAVYGVNRYGQPVVLFTTKEPPGGLPSLTIGQYDEAEVSFLEKRQKEGCPIYVQIRYTKCGSLDNPKLWDAIDHMGMGIVGDISPSDGPVTPYAGGALESSGNVQFDYGFRLVRSSLSALAGGGATALLDVAVVTDALCNDCGNGYPGPDRIVLIATASAAGPAVAQLLISSNGGSTFSAVTGPFAAAENTGFIDYDWIDTDKIRVIVGCTTTDAAALAKIAYADITLGDYTTVSWTVVVSTSATGAVGEVLTSLAWMSNGRLYVATDGGDIYLINDQGESWADAAISSPAVDILGFAKNHNGSNVWAFGETNTIMREVNESGTFTMRVGPNGGGNFTALAVANDSTLYAGNDTSLFKSINEAANEGGWTLLKNFGTARVVKSIELSGGEAARGGDSQVIRVVVDNTTPGSGEVWESIDGGATWRQISVLANGGYNAAVASEVDNNMLLIVGDTSGGVGVIHKMAS